MAHKESETSSEASASTSTEEANEFSKAGEGREVAFKVNNYEDRALVSNLL